MGRGRRCDMKGGTFQENAVAGSRRELSDQ